MPALSGDPGGPASRTTPSRDQERAEASCRSPLGRTSMFAIWPAWKSACDVCVQVRAWAGTVSRTAIDETAIKTMKAVVAALVSRFTEALHSMFWSFGIETPSPLRLDASSPKLYLVAERSSMGSMARPAGAPATRPAVPAGADESGIDSLAGVVATGCTTVEISCSSDCVPWLPRASKSGCTGRGRYLAPGVLESNMPFPELVAS